MVEEEPMHGAIQEPSSSGGAASTSGPDVEMDNSVRTKVERYEKAVRESTEAAERLDAYPKRPRVSHGLVTDAIEHATNRQLRQQIYESYEAYLVGAAKSKEVSLQSLTESDRPKYDESMAKEWANWQRFEAVVPLSAEEEKQIKEAGTRVIGMRWVHTDKNERLRMKSKASLPILAKSRIVV